VGTLPPDLRRAAQDSYKVGLKSVFFFAACMTLLAYIVRLPVSIPSYLSMLFRRLDRSSDISTCVLRFPINIWTLDTLRAITTSTNIITATKKVLNLRMEAKRL
jgi:hypothetical protein